MAPQPPQSALGLTVPSSQSAAAVPPPAPIRQRRPRPPDAPDRTPPPLQHPSTRRLSIPPCSNDASAANRRTPPAIIIKARTGTEGHRHAVAPGSGSRRPPILARARRHNPLLPAATTPRRDSQSQRPPQLPDGADSPAPLDSPAARTHPGPGTDTREKLPWTRRDQAAVDAEQAAVRCGRDASCILSTPSC